MRILVSEMPREASSIINSIPGETLQDEARADLAGAFASINRFNEAMIQIDLISDPKFKKDALKEYVLYLSQFTQTKIAEKAASLVETGEFEQSVKDSVYHNLAALWKIWEGNEEKAAYFSSKIQDPANVHIHRRKKRQRQTR